MVEGLTRDWPGKLVYSLNILFHCSDLLRMAQQSTPFLRPDPPKRKRISDTVAMKVELEEPKQKRAQPGIAAQRPPGWEPEKILGSGGDPEGNTYYVCKIKNSDRAEILTSDEIIEKYPILLCQFYEERMMWHAVEDE